MLEAEAREKEEKRMADIQIQRIRMNATLDARESESRVMADMDRDHIERILLNEEDAPNDSIQALISQCNILSTASCPHVAFSVQNYPSSHVLTSLSGHAMITTIESRLQTSQNNVQLPSQAGHGQSGSCPTLSLLRK